MDRYVFCPNDSMLEEAYAVAKEWSLPILNGDSMRSEKLNFDRTKVGVINIPIFKEFYQCPETVEANMAYSFRYRNDFIDCSNIKFMLSTLNLPLNQTNELSSRSVSPHETAVTVALGSLGEYVLSAVYDKDVIDVHKFIVLSDMSQDPLDLGAYD